MDILFKARGEWGNWVRGAELEGVRGRAGTPLPSLLPLGAARTPSLWQAEHTQRKPLACPRTWGYSGEEAAMDPESEHLPPLWVTIASPSSNHPYCQWSGG